MYSKLLPILSYLIFSQLTFAKNNLNKRYIISGAEKKKLEKEFKGKGFIKNLKYHNAIAVNINPKALNGITKNLQKKFGLTVQITEDSIASINKKPSTPGNGGTTQPAQQVPWGINAISAQSAFAFNKGAGAVVCVVDTGIDKDHPDLMDNIIGGENFVVKKGRVNASAWDDDNNHGTHVSGTIAALDNSIGVVGVAPEASLFGVKVLNSRGSGYNSDVAEGVRSCIRNNANVISMSLGSSSGTTILHEAIQDAAAAGIIIVAAAGNDYGAPVGYPAAYPEVIAVSAVDSSNNLASFSNIGPEIDFTAPGVDILSTVKGGSYSSFNGTSMATPHVSGDAALLISSGRSSIKADDIGLTIEEQGQGLVNALRTVSEY